MKAYLFIFFLILTFSACSSLKRTKVLLPASLYNMKEIKKNIYIEIGMSEEKQQQLLKEIPKAKNMLRKVYGKVKTSPIIYACSTEVCAENFGLEGKIRAVRLLGYLLLKPKELISTTIAHEWSHEELYQRVGGFYPWYREIPIWFDEGLATLVMQKHPRYDEEAWERIVTEKLFYPSKEELVTLIQWGNAIENYLCNDEIVVSYATARHIVNLWYEKVGQKGLVQILESIKDGKQFKKLYSLR